MRITKYPTADRLQRNTLVLEELAAIVTLRKVPGKIRIQKYTEPIYSNHLAKITPLIFHCSKRTRTVEKEELHIRTLNRSPIPCEDSAIAKGMALFIVEYPKDLNATKAAERAGYRWPDKIGPRLLKHSAVKAAIGSQVQERVQAAGLTVDRTLEEVRRVAFFDPIDIFEDDGTVRQMKHISPEARACIAGIEVIELFEGTGDEKHCYGLLKKIKFHDKNSSLDKSMRYHSLYRDKLEVTVNDQFEQMSTEELERYAATGVLPAWFEVRMNSREQA